MRLPVADARLLGKVSPIAAEISCVMSPLFGIVHSCGHSTDAVIGEARFVASHHAWISARDSW